MQTGCVYVCVCTCQSLWAYEGRCAAFIQHGGLLTWSFALRSNRAWLLLRQACSHGKRETLVNNDSWRSKRAPNMPFANRDWRQLHRICPSRQLCGVCWSWIPPPTPPLLPWPPLPGMPFSAASHSLQKPGPTGLEPALGLRTLQSLTGTKDLCVCVNSTCGYLARKGTSSEMVTGRTWCFCSHWILWGILQTKPGLAAHPCLQNCDLSWDHISGLPCLPWAQNTFRVTQKMPRLGVSQRALDLGEMGASQLRYLGHMCPAGG